MNIGLATNKRGGLSQDPRSTPTGLSWYHILSYYDYYYDYYYYYY